MYNILFLTTRCESVESGGTHRITVSLINIFNKYGWNAYWGYKIKEHSLYPEIEQLHIKSEYDLYAFCKEKQINYIIIQGEDTFVDLCHKITNQLKTIKLIYCYHMSPGSELYYQNFRSRIKAFKTAKGTTKIKKAIGLILHPIIYHKFKKEVSNTYKNIINKCDFIILLSDSFTNDFISFAQIKETPEILKKFYSIPNVNSFQELFSEDDLINKKKEVLIVSRLDNRQKRLNKALQIWSHIEKDQRFNDWELNIVGDGPDKNKLLYLQNKLKLKRCHFIGKKNPIEKYKKASIFLMTSAYEGFGLTLIEAQHFGVVPIVYNSYKSVHDIIKDKYNGSLIENNNKKMYIKSLKELLSNQKLRNKYACNAIISSKVFDSESILQKWNCFFQINKPIK